MAEKKTTPLWQRFTQPTPGKAKCNICSKSVSMGAEKGKSKNTTNKWNHLKANYIQDYKEAVKEKEDAAAAVPTNLSQPIVAQLFDSQRKWQNFDQRSKKIDTQILEMIASDNQPFTVVSDVGFGV